MSTTNTQRELIDFLWEWTTPLGNWSKLLVKLVTDKKTELSIDERQEVFDYYLQGIGFAFPTPLPQLTIIKPTFTPSSSEVTLTKLSEVKGVNRLSENQVMEFSPNITVVYGNNGVGKTGYSRILKAQGYSFDDNINILSDVNNTQVGQSAKIEFTSNGTAYTIGWLGGRPKSDLNTISVFNSDCVNISLSRERELLVTPKGFYLFQLITNELAELNRMHTLQIGRYPTYLQWKIQLNENTIQKIFIDGLNHNSKTEKLDELSLFTEQNQTDLTKKEVEVKKLNRSVIETNLKNINLISSELTIQINSVKQTQSNLTKNDWDNIKQYNSELKKLKAITQLGISELARTSGLEQFDTEEFSDFLKSADDYIKLLAKEKYPNNADDTCIYCKQILQTESAKKLIENYHKILNDTTQKDIGKYDKLKSDISERINLLDFTITFHQPAFGVKDDDNIIQPREIIDFNTQVQSFKESIVNNIVDENTEFDINYASIIKLLENKQSEFNTKKGVLTQLLANLTKTENNLNNEIFELKDRKLLSEKKQDVLDCINNFYVQKLLNDNKSHFNTGTLSVKTTQAREELVAQDFQQKFTAELNVFRKQHLGVNIGFYSQQGKSKIRQQISNYKINKVLSEGEQKTIALCEFLTELQLDTSVAPVVFDDPVNSLDHLIIKDVAKRLVKLSKERQVVIFTHNVLFYNAFFELEKHTLNRSIPFTFYNVESSNGVTGILSSGVPINKLRTYTGKLNTICNNGIGDSNETEVALTGYGYLRTSLELLVSNTIFQEIVGRYRSNIMMTKFPTVKGDKIELYKEEIDDMFGRASGYIRAHSHPEEQHVLPTMNDLKADFERFKIIETDFKN